MCAFYFHAYVVIVSLTGETVSAFYYINCDDECMSSNYLSGV